MHLKSWLCLRCFHLMWISVFPCFITVITNCYTHEKLPQIILFFHTFHQIMEINEFLSCLTVFRRLCDITVIKKTVIKNRTIQKPL